MLQRDIANDTKGELAELVNWRVDFGDRKALLHATAGELDEVESHTLRIRRAPIGAEKDQWLEDPSRCLFKHTGVSSRKPWYCWSRS